MVNYDAYSPTIRDLMSKVEDKPLVSRPRKSKQNVEVSYVDKYADRGPLKHSPFANL